MTTVTDPAASDGAVFPRVAKRLCLLATGLLIVFFVLFAVIAAAAWLLSLTGLDLSADARFLMATMMVSSVSMVVAIALHGIFTSGWPELGEDDEADDEFFETDEDDEDAARNAWLLAELANPRRGRDRGFALFEYDEVGGSSRASRPKTNSRNRKQTHAPESKLTQPKAAESNVTSGENRGKRRK